ncbi:hypothetical protein [Ornithobacterium rhinotracheale]|uniref:hypothetical protein n=1 Tax=Ornithobacterium rhinotracheale TaxID=28251 RepID=UPI001FF149D3|nr:hypothetical protein [Ornithobacterium rhinotracheale]MCK0206206.1 hypothetical protein [Ornithobacterium rhinotracheale]
MTLEEYYKAKEQIRIPKGLNRFEEIDYINEKIEELRAQLSNKDLQIILERQRHWEDKMQSSVG